MGGMLAGAGLMSPVDVFPVHVQHETELSVLSQPHEHSVTSVPVCPPASPVMPTAFRPYLYSRFGVGAVCAL